MYGNKHVFFRYPGGSYTPPAGIPSLLVTHLLWSSLCWWREGQQGVEWYPQTIPFKCDSLFRFEHRREPPVYSASPQSHIDFWPWACAASFIFHTIIPPPWRTTTSLHAASPDMLLPPPPLCITPSPSLLSALWIREAFSLRQRLNVHRVWFFWGEELLSCILHWRPHSEV